MKASAISITIIVPDYIGSMEELLMRLQEILHSNIKSDIERRLRKGATPCQQGHEFRLTFISIPLPINLWMDDEVQWYSQYDPLFLTFPPQPPPTLIEQYPTFKYSLQLSSSDRQEWPTVPKLPELSKLFELLESFISDGRNWMKKRCSESEMSGIEEKLNTLMICLQC